MPPCEIHTGRIPPGEPESFRIAVEANEQSEENDALHQLKSLHDGETVLLEAQEISLSETVYIYASEVLIRGTGGGTKIECPPQGGALVIRYSDVSCLSEFLEYDVVL